MGANVQDIDSITLGSGELFIDPGEDGTWINIGQLLNDVTFEYTVELLKLEAGTPRVLITQAKAAEGASLTGEVVELTVTNLQTALGIADEYVDETEAGTPVSVTDEAISFSGADDVYHIGHGDVSSVTITEIEGGATGATYVEDTDYFLNATEGTITAITGGSATMPVDGTTLYLNYTYTPTAKKTINFGGGSGGLPTMGLKFVHTKPDTNTITIVLHKVQTAGSATFTFSDGAWNSIPLTFDAVADSTKSSGSQLGYLEVTTS